LNPERMPEQEDLQPKPTFWPVGFAIGIVVLLIGLVVSPTRIAPIGAVIAIVFGFLWARAATRELRTHTPAVEPERRDGSDPRAAAVAAAPTDGAERFPRNKFLEGATLGIGVIIGGVVTVPVAGFMVLPSFLGQESHDVDLGPISNLTEGQWYIATFNTNPEEGDVARRTAFLRNNGLVKVGTEQVPSFTIISNRCAHLGCPVQANGPTGQILGKPTLNVHGANGPVTFIPVVPAGFGCPCHGGQYDTEGNRTAGPPVRALDRYNFAIKHGRLVLLNLYSVGHVTGTGAQAQIASYKLAGPGQHVDGVEQILYPLQPPHN